MKNRITKYLKKYEELVAYFIVGSFNTILAWVLWLVLSYSIFDVHIVWQNMMLSILSWIVCNCIVYVLNRVFVFKSKAPNILREFIKFSASRLLTLVLDSMMIVILINICNMNEIIAKFITTVTVIIVNYLLSKLLVFKKNETR